MSQVDDVIGQIDILELVLMVVIENIREGRAEADPAAIQELVPSAPYVDLCQRLEQLVDLGALDRTDLSYRVTLLGVEVLDREIDGFEPGRREQDRRDYELLNKIRTRA